MNRVFLSIIGSTTTTIIIALLLLSLLTTVHNSEAQSQQQTQPVSQQYAASTTAKQVVDAYKAGVSFKDYIAAAVKNHESLELTIIKDQLSSGNTACGGADAITKSNMCDGVVSFAKLTCEIDSTISPNCSHQYINQYLSQQRHLDTRAINKGAYKQLAQLMADLHPEAQGNDVVFELR